MSRRKAISLCLALVLAVTASSIDGAGAADPVLAPAAEFGSLGPGTPPFGGPNDPLSLAVDQLGQVYVLHRTTVSKFAADGRPLAAWDLSDYGPAFAGIAAGPDEVLYVTDPSQGRIIRMAAVSGAVSATWAGYANAGQNSGVCPSGVAADAAGNVFVTCPQGWGYAKISSTGNLLFKRDSCVIGPIAVDLRGRTFLTDCGSIRTLLIYGPDGSPAGSIGRRLPVGKTYANEGEFGPFIPEGVRGGIVGGAAGVATDRDGNVWVADPDNRRFQGFSADGSFLASCKVQQNAGPQVLATAPGGIIYASNFSTVQRYDPGGAGPACDSRARRLLVGRQGLALRRDGSVKVSVACKAPDLSCRGVATIRRQGKSLGGKRFDIAPGSRSRVAIKLRPRSRRVVRRKGRLAVRIQAAARVAPNLRYGARALRVIIAPKRQQ